MYRSRSLKRAEQSQKTQPIKRRKELPKEEEREKIVLFNEKLMRQFKVFLDEEIGMTLKYSNKTILSQADEDCDSSQEVIEDGLKKCQKMLKSKVLTISKKLSTQDVDSSSSESCRESLKISEATSENISE